LQIRIIGDLVPNLVNAGTLELHTGSRAGLQLGVVSEASGAQIHPDTLPAGVAVSAQLRADDQSLVGSVGPLSPAALTAVAPMSCRRRRSAPAPCG